MAKTCRKGIHQYEGDHCKMCALARVKEYKRKARKAAGIPVRVCVPGGSPVEQRKRWRESTNARHPNLMKDAQVKYREKVGLGYAAWVMRVRVQDVPIPLLEAKAALIRLNRKLRDEKNG